MSGRGTDSVPGDADRLRRRVLWKMPTGLYVIGSCDGEHRNLMTANLVVQLATEPRVIGVSIESAARTHELIAAGKAFAVSILARSDRALVRRFVKPLDDAGDPAHLGGEEVRVAATGSPILEHAVAFVDCRVVGEMNFASHTLFAGEVVDAGFLAGNEEEPVLRMEDTRMHYGG